MNKKPFLLPAKVPYDVLTKTANQHLGIFHISGLGPLPPEEPHTIVLKDVFDNGHALEINVNYGETSSFQIINKSDVLTNPKAEFTFKHSGVQKKRFKPGDVITSPEVHTLTWETLDLKNNPVIVNLSLIPLPEKHGIQIYYETKPAPTVSSK